MAETSTTVKVAEQIITTWDTDCDFSDEEHLDFLSDALDDLSIDACANSALSDPESSKSSKDESDNEESSAFVVQPQTAETTCNYVLGKNTALQDRFYQP